MACTCRLVGALDIGYRGVYDINISHRREVINLLNGEIARMPLITTITISAYPFDPGAVFEPTSCPTNFNASFKWTRIYDCDQDKYFYIYNKVNTINYIGDTPEYITVYNSEETSSVIKASASSGPYSVYMEEMGYVGSGMNYTGNPIQFDTEGAPGDGFSSVINILGFDVILKSFSYNKNTTIENVSYTFEGGEGIEVMTPDEEVVEEC